jgi:hypothetical protein
MENHAQSIEDNLVEGLSFKLKPGASYVTNRRSVTYFPQGSNIYSVSGTRVIKFNITGDQWLDPQSLRLMFQVKNKHETVDLEFLNYDPNIMFRRVRLIAGGQIIEDIDNYQRLSCMFNALKSEEGQLTTATEGFGNYDYQATQSPLYTAGQLHDLGGHIRYADETRWVMCKPFLGLFNQDKYLPIRYCPLQIEFELVNTGAEIVDTTTMAAGEVDWEILLPQIKCDVITLDNSLDNEYTQHMLSGKSLPINFNSFAHMVAQTGATKDFSVNVVRTFTRLKSVFITLYDISAATAKLKEANYFFHPADAQATDLYYSSEEHTVQLQIGSKLYPEYPIQGVVEAFYHLRKTLGFNHKMNMIARWYRTSKYIIGIDLEKVPGAGFTGTSTKAGDLITLNVKDCDFNSANIPDKCYICLNYDAVLQIQEGGVIVLE